MTSLKRTTHADGTVSISVRADPFAEWSEVSRSAPAEANRLQKVYENPLVREVFLEMQGIEIP